MISIAKQDHSVPEWAGLILIGGKSRRMHTDKSTLPYRGKAHREYLADLLLGFTPHVFFSTGISAKTTLYPKVELITDQEKGAGPLGGIVSAHLRHPSLALLVMACDMPFIDAPLIKEILTQRNPEKMATSFEQPDSKRIEPLFTLYEPRGLKELTMNFKNGERSPSKLLENMQVEWLTPKLPEKLTNVNDPRAMEAALTVLKQSNQ